MSPQHCAAVFGCGGGGGQPRCVGSLRAEKARRPPSQEPPGGTRSCQTLHSGLLPPRTVNGYVCALL